MDFTKLSAYLDVMPQLNVPGCDLAVYRDHEPIFRRQVGWRDDEKKTPMQGDEAFLLYSCTKVTTTCAAMQLIEQGKMRLDDPVSVYLPAYADLKVKDGETVRPARTVMTIRHLMSMQSGLNYDYGPQVQAAFAANKENPTTRQFADAKALEPLEFDPGDNFLYSLSHDVLGAVIEVVSGQRLSEYMKEHIWKPLGLTTLSFRVTKDIQSRLCALYTYDYQKGLVLKDVEKEAMRRGDQWESGGGGLIGSTDDYIAFGDALACGGRGKNGAKILSPEMIQLWSANQLGPRSRKSFDGWKRLGYSYALGVRTRVNSLIGGGGPVGEFGWDGAAGAWLMIDPANRVSAFFGMHVLNYGYNYDVIHPTLRSLIYEGLGL